MKKRIALLLAGVLAVASLTACGGNTDNASTVNVGVGMSVDFTYGSYSVGDQKYGKTLTEGIGQADVHVAAVTLAEDGTIADIQIDAVQVMANFDATGKITSDLTATFTSKADLKEGYDMKKASGISKEWYEQADNFETWCKGKTPDQVAALAVDEEGKPTDDTITSGCTIVVTELKAAVADACANAKAGNWTAASTDTLGLGVDGRFGGEHYNWDASAEKDGQIQAYVTYAATTTDAEGKITCAVVDCVQANSTFDTTGKITTDLETKVVSKYNLKEKYDMKKASPIGKEWYEQTEAFMTTIKGMTADQVAAIAVDGEGKPTDDTLTTGCTMTVTEMIQAVVNAIK